MRDFRGVSVQSKGQLGQVIGTDGETVEDLAEFFDEDDIAGNLNHHIDFQPIFPLDKAFARQDADHLFPLIHGTAEGYHHFHIGEAHFIPDFLHGFAFQGEGIAILVIIISRCAAEPDHGILFMGFEVGTAHEVGVFVTLEIAHPDNDVIGVESGTDLRHTLCQNIDKKITLLGVTLGSSLDFLSSRLVGYPVEMNQRQWMDADEVVDDEFKPGQADAVVGNGRQGEGIVGTSHIQHDFCLRPLHILDVYPLYFILQKA
ncbi:MAG: hypothetical protein A4E72_01462 [Syntrophus sp. PtaU1.Bin208]|nr:MAG: hypothetical protein A4E72_01462 [Syntrophus sp. PtaU1.Bin208]